MITIFKYITQIGWPIVILFVFFLLDPFELGYLAGYVLVPIIYTRRAFLAQNLDFDFFILFLFSLVYGLFYFFQPEMLIQTFLFFALFPPIFYLLGKYVAFKIPQEHNLYLIILIVGVLFSSTALLSVSQSLIKGGFIQVERTLPNFWTGTPMSATKMGSFFTFNMCIPALILVGRNKFNILFKLLGLGIFVVSLLCIFRLGSRTQVAICAFSTGLALIYLIPRQNIKQNLKLFIILFFTGLLIYLYIPLSLDADYLSVLGDRINNPDSSSTASAGNRTQRWAKSIENLFIKPFGWSRNEFGYSHNLWFDVAQDSGLLPFIFLLIFTIRNFINTKRALFLRGKDISFKSLILTFVMAANLQFFVEPIMQGAFSMFVVYCFFQGVIKNYIEKNEVMNTKAVPIK